VNQLLRVQNFNVSSDGFGAGDQQSIERPFGHADPGGAPGTTTTGAAGGTTSPRFTPRCSC